jgi:transposase
VGKGLRSSGRILDHVGGDADDRLDAQKKTPIAYERERDDVARKREAFVELQPHLDSRRLVFVDESGFRLGSPPRHGWAPRGEDSPGRGIHGRWEMVTMIGAIAHDGFRGFMTVNAGTSVEVFEAFVTHQLIPNLQPGDIVVMDNLSAHKNAGVRKQLEGAGCRVVFTPPYSPEYNPIEKTWAKLKDIVRRVETRTRDAFDAALAHAMDQVSEDDIHGWFHHSGYRLSST